MCLVKLGLCHDACFLQVALPEGYMKAAFQHVREHGGVCIADEVQVCSLCECVVLPASVVSFTSMECVVVVVACRLALGV